jgi:hypothetical protein
LDFSSVPANDKEVAIYQHKISYEGLGCRRGCGLHDLFSLQKPNNSEYRKNENDKVKKLSGKESA